MYLKQTLLLSVSLILTAFIVTGTSIPIDKNKTIPLKEFTSLKELQDYVLIHGNEGDLFVLKEPGKPTRNIRIKSMKTIREGSNENNGYMEKRNSGMNDIQEDSIRKKNDGNIFIKQETTTQNGDANGLGLLNYGTNTQPSNSFLNRWNNLNIDIYSAVSSGFKTLQQKYEDLHYNLPGASVLGPLASLTNTVTGKVNELNDKAVAGLYTGARTVLGIENEPDNPDALAKITQHSNSNYSKEKSLTAEEESEHTKRGLNELESMLKVQLH